MTTKPWTVLDLLDWTRKDLESRGVDSPRLAGELLLAKVLGCSRIELYTRHDYQPTGPEREAFRDLVRRAREHEPVAYLLGTKEFYSLPLKVTPDVLIPRPETEMLVTTAAQRLRELGRPGRAWDVCTGSGCVALALAKQVPDVTVLATDVSEPAVAVADENARSLGLDDRVRVRAADLLTLPDDCEDMAPFDCITGNPPYVCDEEAVADCVLHEPRIALRGGADGLDLIRRLVDQVPAVLAPEGWLVLEFGVQQTDEIRDLLLDRGDFGEPRIYRDYQHLERIVVAQYHGT